MTQDGLPPWPRDRYQPGEGRALLFYAVYGKFTNDVPVSRLKYRSAGLPYGFTLNKIVREGQKPLPFTDGELGKVIKDKALYERIRQAPECLVLRGEIADPRDLNYLRDSVGLMMFAMDQGGIAICDPQQFELYDAARWRREIFEPGPTNLLKHAKILLSDESGGSAGRLWVHTRGLRKFGRPDLSVRNVPREQLNNVTDLCNRFMQLQIQGGRIEEGQEIKMHSLPPGLICHHDGSPTDPDFNNVHVEIPWPVK